jgi:pseudaminic acid synthase
MTIQNRKIGKGEPCFVIAELSGNHHGKYEEAEQLVRAAAEAGADAVKLQTYTADTITLNSRNKPFIVGGKGQPDLWKQKSLYELYEVAYTPWEWQPKLKELAESLGLLFFSSPFDDTAVDFLENMGVAFYKIASYEAIHIPLLKKVAETGKPVIMSIGFASQEEATLAVETLKKHGSGEIAVLHCVTSYTDQPRLSQVNLETIEDIAERFDVVAGFSDNNGGITIPILAATMGAASIVEKHLILDRSKEGPDARFSIEPAELKEMVETIRKYEKAGPGALLGDVAYGPVSEQEAENIVFRPSIWAKKEIKKGEELTLENIRVARPSGGLAPQHFEDVLGKKAAQDIAFATPITWDHVYPH